MARMRSTLAVILSVLCVGIVLAGCGSSSSKSSTTPTSSTNGGQANVTVALKDWTFAVSGKLTQGGSIKLSNDGAEMHMMSLGKMKAGVTLSQVQDAVAKADPASETDPLENLLDEVGWPGAVVPPGRAVTIAAGGLTPGTYALICFMPSEGTGQPHFLRGMVNELEVVSGAATAPSADATYKVTLGQPITGPSSLSAGKHTIELTSDGDTSKLQPTLIQAQSADQTPEQINDLINSEFGEIFGEKPPPKGLGAKVAQLIVFAGDDMGSNKTATFTYDFKPGTYYLAAQPDTGNDTASAVPKELIKITVK